MIEWFDKLPDSLTGVALGCAVWFGFNYAVLAPRAIERDAASIVMESCVATLDRQDEQMRRQVDRAVDAIGIPELGGLLGPMAKRLNEAQSSPEDRARRCTCAVSSAKAQLRFDYAIHTATLRLVAPQSVSGFERDALALLFGGACGALPGFMGGVQ